MGLSASQGRMLLLTARQDDLEFQAQTISQRRLILAQELEKISQDYEESTTNRQMKIGLYDAGMDEDKQQKVYKNLTYAMLISGTMKNPVARKSSGIQGDEDPEYYSNAAYRLVSSDGAIVVSKKDEIAGAVTTVESYTTKGYNKDSDDNKIYTDLHKLINVKTFPGQIYEMNDKGTLRVTYDDKTGVDENGETIVKEVHRYFNPTSGAELDPSLYAKEDSFTVSEDYYDIEKTEDGDISYKKDNVKSLENGALTLVDGGDGLVSIKNQSGVVVQRYIVDGALKYGKNNPNYLQDAIRNGKYLIQKGNDDVDDGEFKWRNVGWDSLANVNDNYYTEDDDAAKAKYDRLQTQIQNQDKKLELELNEIETQRNAVKTEIESVQKVMDDDIESTFKIFS